MCEGGRRLVMQHLSSFLAFFFTEFSHGLAAANGRTSLLVISMFHQKTNVAIGGHMWVWFSQHGGCHAM